MLLVLLLLSPERLRSVVFNHDDVTNVDSIGVVTEADLKSTLVESMLLVVEQPSLGLQHFSMTLESKVLLRMYPPQLRSMMLTPR